MVSLRSLNYTLLGVILLIFAVAESRYANAQDCVTGTGYLTPEITELRCVYYSTDITHKGVPGTLYYAQTQDSVIYSYVREGFNPSIIARRRSTDAVEECTFVHNGVLRMVGYLSDH